YILFTSHLYKSRHHPNLHSFPTRRSSDLPDEVERPEEVTQLPATSAGQRDVQKHESGDDVQSQPPLRLRTAARINHLRGERPVRSEEHTSELQSRFDLVCRLLLEKKKYNI